MYCYCSCVKKFLQMLDIKDIKLGLPYLPVENIALYQVPTLLSRPVKWASAGLVIFLMIWMWEHIYLARSFHVCIELIFMITNFDG